MEKTPYPFGKWEAEFLCVDPEHMGWHRGKATSIRGETAAEAADGGE